MHLVSMSKAYRRSSNPDIMTPSQYRLLCYIPSTIYVALVLCGIRLILNTGRDNIQHTSIALNRFLQLILDAYETGSFITSLTDPVV